MVLNVEEFAVIIVIVVIIVIAIIIIIVLVIIIIIIIIALAIMRTERVELAAARISSRFVKIKKLVVSTFEDSLRCFAFAIINYCSCACSKYCYFSRGHHCCLSFQLKMTFSV